jgi:hypothetical protein
MITRRQYGPYPAAIKRESLSIGPIAGQRGAAPGRRSRHNRSSALRDALSEELGGRAGDVHLELAGLRFIDVGCAREILAATAQHPGTHVIIHHPPAALRRIATLIWPEAGIDMM